MVQEFDSGRKCANALGISHHEVNDVVNCRRSYTATGQHVLRFKQPDHAAGDTSSDKKLGTGNDGSGGPSNEGGINEEVEEADGKEEAKEAEDEAAVKPRRLPGSMPSGGLSPRRSTAA